MQSPASFRVLQQFARRGRKLERCELCSIGLRSDHPHLVELGARRLVCSCDACAILFSNGPGGKFKRVPRRLRSLPEFHLSETTWNNLMVPINMVFFYQSSVEHRVIALYPSPAGAMESLLPLQSWNDLVASNPILDDMEPDVEGLLVNRLGDSRTDFLPQYYLLPIDQCFQLVGLIRMHWKGLSGGTEVWEKLGEFFSRIKAQATEMAGSEPSGRAGKEALA
jgi:Family of unknown function (DUF5947)